MILSRVKRSSIVRVLISAGKLSRIAKSEFIRTKKSQVNQLIISHENKFVFIEVPHTASTAISSELCEHYGGERICYKHANYSEFYAQASALERQYFVFGAVRNPLDAMVTEFCKFREDHKGSFSNPANHKVNGGWVEDGHVEKYRFVQNNEGDFAKYFNRYQRKIYFNWFLLGHRRFAKVMRFESIKDEFDQTLRLMNITPKRTLPMVNKTERPDSFGEFFTPDLHRDTARCYGPFLEYWGYSLPDSFGATPVPRAAKLQYGLVDKLANSVVRKVCLTHKNKTLSWLHRLVSR